MQDRWRSVIMSKLVPKPILIFIWMQDLNFLKFNFLIYKMGVIISPYKRGWCIKDTHILAPSSKPYCIYQAQICQMMTYVKLTSNSVPWPSLSTRVQNGPHLSVGTLLITVNSMHCSLLLVRTHSTFKLKFDRPLIGRPCQHFEN